MKNTFTPQTAELQLIKLAQAGNRDALSRLLFDYEGQLTRFIEGHLPISIRSTIGREDICQETFRVAFLGMDGFENRHEGGFYGWLRTIALNQIRDSVKAHQSRKRGGGRTRITYDQFVSNLFGEVEANGASPFRDISRQDICRFLRIMVASLPTNYQNVLRLQFEDGLTYEQIGERIGKSPQAVKGILKRAKDQLRKDLGNASSYLSSR